MELIKGTMLDGRYKLIKALGTGASAQVWLAHDSLANIRVAVKVFDDIEGDGIAEFQQEFSRVYNINHQNLLTPTNYSVSGDVPYLVMPYCENGSVQSMVGRCDQSDIVPFIRDVAAALANLHANNIVHQDIKPENILIDDNMVFKVSDFGISIARDDENMNYGGTYPYMAAERFNGVLEPSGDIWALGATAFEMIEGEPPFGSDGGITQAQGNPVPPITKAKIDNRLYDLICKMLDPDPALRPTADAIQAEMEFYLRYKRWPGHNPVRQYSIVAIILAVFTVGLIWFGYSRTRVYYCKDYVEVNREPQMIDIITGSEHAQRYYSYRVEVQRGHVRRVTLVNSKGFTISAKDYRQLPLRYPDQEYRYKDGKVTSVVCRDENGCQVLSYKYDEDKDGNDYIEFNKPNNDPQYYTSTYYSEVGLSELYPGNSKIIRMVIHYDSAGRVSEREYRTQTSPISDANGAFYHRLTYTDAGQVASLSHLGADGSTRVGDATGCAMRRFEYDDNLSLKRVSMFGVDSVSPACDYQGRAVVNLQCDEYGNVVYETHTDVHGRRFSRRLDGAYGFKVVYENGFCKEYYVLNADSALMKNNNGFAYVKFEPDPVTGHDKYRRFYNADGGFVYGVKVEYDSFGRDTCTTYVTETGNATTGPNGFSTVTQGYDNDGHINVTEFFDENHNPTEVYGTHRSRYFYSDGWRLDSIVNYDNQGNVAPDLDGVCVIKYGYRASDDTAYDDFNSVPTSESYFDADHKPVLSRNGYSSKINGFDSNGRLITVEFYGTDAGQPVKLYGSISSIEIEYEGARVKRVKGLQGRRNSAASRNVVCVVSAERMPDGRQLLTAPAISDKPVAFYEMRDSNSTSILAKGADGESPINVVMPNGIIAHRMTMDANGAITCTALSGGPSLSSKENVNATYYIISTYFYSYLMLYPSVVTSSESRMVETAATENAISGVASTAATTSGSSPAVRSWQRTLEQQNANLPRVLEVDDGYAWQLQRYEWTDNLIIVVLKAKHITGTTGYDEEDVNDYIRRFKTYPQRQFGITVPVRVRVLNNQGKTLVER